MWADPRIWQAVIAGGFVAIGWIVNGWQNRRVERRLRAEKLRDVHRALFAEIGANLATLGSIAELEDWGQGLIARMNDDPGLVPFIPREKSDRVFSTIVGEINVLPRATIDAIVAYYGQLERIAALAEDMRSPEFSALQVPRRIAVYSDYIKMKKQALEFGEFAKTMIVAYAEGGRDRAETVRKTYVPRSAATVAPPVNSPDAGRSGQ